MNNIKKISALLMIAVFLFFASGCTDDDPKDGTVTVRITGITNGDLDENEDGQQILAGTFNRGNQDDVLAFASADCSTGAGTYTLVLREVLDWETLQLGGNWKAEGGEKYDFVLFLDGDGDGENDTPGVDYKYKYHPLVIEIDGDHEITARFPEDFVEVVE